jgi:phosphoribosylformylglycinamidine cyclo-ligase
VSGPGAYEKAGVDYGVLDAAKRRSIAAVNASLDAPLERGALVERASIGEPAQLFYLEGLALGTVLECLGTKSELARQFEEVAGPACWAAIAADAVAAILNDLACLGALPLVVSAYLATGSADWYQGERHARFVEGFEKACREAGAAWVGGESPTLAGIIDQDSADIAGSAIGRVPAGTTPFAGARLQPGDEIVLVASSGLHANGASLARAVAAGLEEGLSTLLPSGQSFGEAVLLPSVSYVPLVAGLRESPLGEQVHYATHLTGHGFRKLMRADRPFTYRVEHLQEVPEVLSFIVERAGLSKEEAYGTFNMGSGFGLFTSAGHGEAAVSLAHELGYGAVVAGRLEQGDRRVVLEPLSVTYDEESLELR